MIRLNESILNELVTEHQKCPPMESTLIAFNMSLWPTFQKVMGMQADSLKRINGTIAGGVFSKSGVKDSAVQVSVIFF